MTTDFWKLRFSELSASLAVGSLLSTMSWDLIARQNEPNFAAFSLTALFVSRLAFGLVLGPVSDGPYRQVVLRWAIILPVLISFFMEVFTQFSHAGLNIYICEALVLGFPHGSIQPIANAVVPSIVPEDEMEKAFRHYFALQSVFSVLGVFLGMVSLQQFGMSVALFIPLILSIASFLVFNTLRLEISTKKRKYENTRSYLVDMFLGLRLFKRFKTELYWGIASALINSIITPVVALIIPIFIARNFHKDPIFVALLEGLISVGVFLGATYGDVLTSRFRFMKKHVVQLAFVIMGLSILVLAFSNSLFIWCVSLAVLGIAIVVNNSIIEARRAIAIPEPYRGRIQLAHGLAIQSAIPLGLFIVGGLVDKLPLAIILFAGGAAALLIAVFLLQIPGLKTLLDLPDGSVEGCYDTLFPASPSSAETEVSLKSS